MADSRRTRLILGVLIVAALVLITLNYGGGGSGVFGGVRTVTASVFGGAERAFSDTTGLVHSPGSGVSAAQVQAMRREIVRLRAQNAGEKLSRAQYAQLHKMLALAGKGGYRVVAANVIASGTDYAETVTLDAGSSAGIKPKETVINGQGLVGEVTSVSSDTSTVLLATDSSATVGVRLARSGQTGWVTGPGKTSGSGDLALQILDASAVLKPGQQLVTTASVGDRPYVAGVPVGTIASVVSRAGSLTAKATVRPFVNFTALGVVGVVVDPPRHNPRYSVLPAKPASRHPRATPTVTVTVTPGVAEASG